MHAGLPHRTVRPWAMGPLALIIGIALLAGCDVGSGAPSKAGPERRSAPSTAAAELVRNVVVVSIDTLRADRLDGFGYERGTAPNLDGLGQRGVVFVRAQSQSGQTAPAHASLFTSAYGETHGIINVHGNASSMRTLPSGLRTLAEVASDFGVETAAFVSNGNLTRGMGMDRGFGVWDERNEEIVGRVEACKLVGERTGRLALLHTYRACALRPPRVRRAFR
jgi:hypothetical protein